MNLVTMTRKKEEIAEVRPDWVEAWEKEGWRVKDAPKSDVPDRDAIATMPKGEVREWIEAHGANVPKGATVEEMRAALTTMMFVDI